MGRRDICLIWIIVGHGPAVSAGEGFWTFFLSSVSFFSLFLGYGLVQTEILSQRDIKPKTTNQPIDAPIRGWGILLIWIIVEHGSAVLAVGAGEGCLDIFLSFVSFLFPSLWEMA